MAIKNITWFAGMVLLSVFVSCAPAIQINGSWMNQELTGKERFQKIFLFVMAPDPAVRNTVEEAQAEAALPVQTIKSATIWTGVWKGDTQWGDLINQIKATGCDAVFTSALVDAQAETTYAPGEQPYVPFPKYAHYETFDGYAAYFRNIMQDPDYLDENKTYHIESNLYDVSDGQIIWSVQSEGFQPAHLASASKSYAKLLMKRLKEDGGLYRKR